MINRPGVAGAVLQTFADFFLTPFVCFKTVFTFYVAPPSPPKKSTRGQKFFPTIGWCEFTPAWKNNKQKL